MNANDRADVGRVPSHGETANDVPNAASGDAAYIATRDSDVGPVTSPDVPSLEEPPPRRLRRLHRVWPDRDGNISYLLTPCVDGRARVLDNEETFHDHKFRTPESESRKWEYVCLNPVRYGLVKRPEEWPYGGEIFYDDTGGPRLVRGTPPLLECGLLIEDKGI